MLGSDPNQTLLKDSLRLGVFLQECLLLGSLRGFKHFETFIRGREELILCVYTNGFEAKNSALMPTPIIETHYDSENVKSWNLPPLTSPLDEDLSKEKDKIIFLIAGYAKYRCPYVWLRSHRNALLKTESEEPEGDYPLQLDHVMGWKTNNVSLWEIVTEILDLTSQPKNPFEINFDFIEHLPIEEAVLLIGSLLSFLKNIWVEADTDVTFVDLVYEDFKKLQSIHIDKIHSYSLKTIYD